MKFLHTMIRTTDPQASIHFYTQGLGLQLIRQKDYPNAKFSLYFLAECEQSPMIELTHNWDEQDYVTGNQFGHLAFGVDNIYHICEHLMAMKITINRPPRDGRMAFVKDPDGFSIELLQQGEPLEPMSPWTDMENQGSW